MSARFLFGMLAFVAAVTLWGDVVAPSAEPEPLVASLSGLFVAYLCLGVSDTIRFAGDRRAAQVRLALYAGIVLMTTGTALRLLPIDRVYPTVVTELGLVAFMWGEYRAGRFPARQVSLPDG